MLTNMKNMIDFVIWKRAPPLESESLRGGQGFLALMCSGNGGNASYKCSGKGGNGLMCSNR